MTLVVTLLLCIAVILLGAVQGNKVGWVVVVLGALALLLAVLGGVHVSVGR